MRRMSSGTGGVLFMLLLPALVAGQAEPTRLSLKQAIGMALGPGGSARVELARQAALQAGERSAQARSALLPNLEASVSEQNQTRNLAAFGIKFDIPIPGFAFPRLAGPFSVFDARASLTQSVLDLAAIRRYQAARAAGEAAAEEAEAVEDAVTFQVAQLYLAALLADARLEAARADLRLAERLLELAQSQRKAGTAAAIEVTRAEVQLAQARQQVLLGENERRRAHLELKRAIGMELEQEIELTDREGLVPPVPASVEEALGRALEERADWKAQQRRLRGAELAYSSVKLERVPALVAFADYGSIGNSIHEAIPTRAYGLALRVPVFDGGRRDSRRVEARSQLEQERTRSRDLRRQIELEIRVAMDEIVSAEQQLKVAEQGLQQAEAELAQAERRYKAGVASSLEVTDAQTRLSRARQNRLSAFYLRERARLSLCFATGEIRQLAR